MLQVYTLAQTVPGDDLTVICHIVDQNLHRQVDWARVSPFFDQLEVRKSLFVLRFHFSF